MLRVLGLTVAALAVASAWEPDEEDYIRKRGLQSGGWGTRAPDVTQTGCTPPAGGDLPQTTASTPDHLNEPCYVHDAACTGYVVCCVKKDTCVSTHGGMVSSNS